MIEPKKNTENKSIPKLNMEMGSNLIFNPSHFIAGRDFSDVVHEGRPVPDDL